MDLLTLPEAWRWVQIGACAAFGAAAIFATVNILLAELSQPAPVHIPDPHCSRCCPNPDDELDDIPP